MLKACLQCFPKFAAFCCQLLGLADKVLLLWADHAAGAAYADVADGLLSCEAMVLYQVGAYEHPCPAQACFAVYRQGTCATQIDLH